MIYLRYIFFRFSIYALQLIDIASDSFAFEIIFVYFAQTNSRFSFLLGHVVHASNMRTSMCAFPYHDHVSNCTRVAVDKVNVS